MKTDAERIESLIAAGNEMSRIIDLPKSTDFREWATELEIDAALAAWRALSTANEGSQITQEASQVAGLTEALQNALKALVLVNANYRALDRENRAMWDLLTYKQQAEIAAMRHDWREKEMEGK